MSGLTTATFPALGTTAQVVVSGAGVLAAARAAVEREVAVIDLACSRFRPDSELSRVNRAGGRPTRIGPLLAEALELALRAAAQTGGDLDPTVGGALELLGYDRDFAAVPAAGGPIRVRARPVAGWRTVEFDPTALMVRVPAGVRLDLGATAKALAADRAARRAAERAGCGVLVSLGGDVAVAGPPPVAGWPVRVADDHAAPPGAPAETVAISVGGLATSSTTVRAWRRGGRLVHHIVDPSTGRPADSCWRTVSVAAASCAEANVASTAALLRGRRGEAWLASLGLPARLVERDGNVRRVGAWPAPVAAA